MTVNSTTTMTSAVTRRAHRTLTRDALAIVLVGSVLGVSFNVVQRSSRPPRGLAWIPAAQPLESVDRLVSVGEGPGPRQAATSAKRAVDHPEPVLAARSAPPAPVLQPRPALPHAQVPGSEAASDPPVRAHGFDPGLPEIPDVGHPLRVELPTVSLFVEADAALIVDAREREEFAEGHLPGAVNVPYDDAMRDPALVRSLEPHDRPIIVYCSGGSCESSRYLAELMVRDFQLKRVLVYEGGFPEWAAAGKPVAKAAP